MSFQWKFTSDQKDKFRQLFRQIDSDSDGKVSGPDAASLFSKSNLDVSVLSTIWKMVVKNDYIEENEFLVVSFLIFAVSKGQALPNGIPESLFLSMAPEGEGKPMSKGKKEQTQTQTQTQTQVPQISVSKEELGNELSSLLESLNTPIPELPINELTAKYGINDLVPVYNSNELISKVETSIPTIEIAKKVLETSEPEFKSLFSRLEKENSIKESLIEKHNILDNQLKLSETQKNEFLKQYYDFNNQIVEIEKESRQIEVEKNKLLGEIQKIQSEISGPNFDTSSLQAQRNQIAQQHTQTKNEYQNDALEHKKLINEIESLKKEFEKIKIDTKWDDYGFKENLED